MSKSKKNGDYLINQIMMFSKFFENFKSKNDTNNMFVVLYEIRVLHGLMLLKLNKIIKKLSSVDSPGNEDLYDLSIFNNMVESTNDLIHNYENIIYDNVEKENIKKEDSKIPIIESSDIKNDIDKTFNEKINYMTSYNLDNPTLINFYTPLSDESNKFNLIWKKLKKDLKAKNINLIQVDCNNKKDKCKKFKILEFPTVKMFYKKKMYSFDGDRTYDNIMSFIQKHTSLN